MTKLLESTIRNFITWSIENGIGDKLIITFLICTVLFLVIGAIWAGFKK